MVKLHSKKECHEGSRFQGDSEEVFVINTQGLGLGFMVFIIQASGILCGSRECCSHGLTVQNPEPLVSTPSL